MPSSVKTWLIPSFFPMIALFIDKVHLRYSLPLARPYHLLLEFDLDVHTCGQAELLQRGHRSLGRAVNVDQPLVRAQFELLAAVLVLVYRAKYRHDLFLGRERNGS